jgi:hypothetical protein
LPLSFLSLSHGEIPFGFFNIETDLLLLSRFFFFAADFCRAVTGLSNRAPQADGAAALTGYHLHPEAIGDLHGAIQGIRLTGFIGEIYRLFPFPEDLKRFKQNPEGYRTREKVERIIQGYSPEGAIHFCPEQDGQTIRIGDVLFDREGFRRLLEYVWLGGYPRWRNGTRPAYVQAMKEAVELSDHPLLQEMVCG